MKSTLPAGCQPGCDHGRIPRDPRSLSVAWPALPPEGDPGPLYYFLRRVQRSICISKNQKPPTTAPPEASRPSGRRKVAHAGSPSRAVAPHLEAHPANAALNAGLSDARHQHATSAPDGHLLVRSVHGAPSPAPRPPRLAAPATPGVPAARRATHPGIP